MTNILTFIYSHYAIILTIIASLHYVAEVVEPIINKPGFNKGVSKVFSYLAPVLGVATKVVEANSPAAKSAVTALTGDAAKLASGQVL